MEFPAPGQGFQLNIISVWIIEELFSKSSVMNLCVFVEEEMMVVEAERNISLDLHPPGLADHIAWDYFNFLFDWSHHYSKKACIFMGKTNKQHKIIVEQMCWKFSLLFVGEEMF